MPTVNAMNSEGRTFKGCLYFGLMLTKDGPKVIEYNCRFGDPETQVVLPLLESDLLEIMMAVSDEKLSDIDVEFANQSACCVVMASEGYPQKYQSGFKITVDGDIDAQVYFAGAKLENENVVTAGGRVLGIVCKADTLEDAIKKAYDNIHLVSFENAYYRSDIGQKALAYIKENG